MGFQVQVRDKIAQLILEKIKIPTIQKVTILSAIDRGSGGLGSMGLQSSDSSISVIQKENGAEKIIKVEKGRIREGRKEKITPSSHTTSQQEEAEPSGNLWQTTNQDQEATIVVPGVDVVYPLHGDSAIKGGSKVRASDRGDTNK